MIQLNNIVKTYTMGDQIVQAVNGVSLTIASGEFVAIMGASGSGKSTLMHIMGLLDRPQSGQYILAGEDITALSDDQQAALRNRLIGFVFQQFHLLARRTAIENAGLPLVYANQRHSLEKVRQELSAVGLTDRATHRPNQLSGGQQQRVAIARALVNDPFIIMADEPTGNLDSKSKDEIVTILKELHKKGKTIIMVTHEAEMASHASRVIVMRDGNIISDEKRGQNQGAVVGDSFKTILDEVLRSTKKRYDLAKFFDSVNQAVYAMIANKLRSFLSILGILIGVAAVIAMLALGSGARASIETQLASLGSNLLMIRPGQINMQAVAMQAGDATRLTFGDLNAIGEMPSVRRVSPSVTGRVQAVYAGKNTNTQLEGTSVSYAAMRSAQPAVGRFFTEEETRTRAKVTLLGTTVVRALFGDNNPIGETIKINAMNFVVVGILPPKGAGGFRDQDDTIIVPITTAMARVLGKDYLDTIYAEGDSPEILDDLAGKIGDLLKQRHRIIKKYSSDEAFQIRNMADLKNAIAATTKTMTILLGVIAAISLVVGGIGIMNIMLVSVTERTKEIGLRKALGATGSDILVQFLVESALMACIGGSAGILLGAGASYLLTLLAGWTIQVSLGSIILATTFSVTVGIVFGLWPAQKAAQLNPIEALRYE
jgi:macrolide transport system ATP-binding/permease protein